MTIYITKLEYDSLHCIQIDDNKAQLPGPSGSEGLGPGPNMSHAFLSFSIGSHVVGKCFVAFTTLSARGHFAYDAAASFPCLSALVGRVRTSSPWSR